MNKIFKKMMTQNLLIIFLIVYIVFIGVKCSTTPRLVKNPDNTETENLIINDDYTNLGDKIGLCFTSPNTAKKYIDSVFYEELNRDMDSVDYINGAEITDYLFVESINEWFIRYNYTYPKYEAVADGGSFYYVLEGKNGKIHRIDYAENFEIN